MQRQDDLVDPERDGGFYLQRGRGDSTRAYSYREITPTPHTGAYLAPGVDTNVSYVLSEV